MSNSQDNLNNLITVFPVLDKTGYLNAEERLKHLKALADKLGLAPRDKVIFHIAGTSGKGSTTMILSKLLQITEQRVGIFLSPFILNIEESFQINNQPVSVVELAEAIRHLTTVIKQKSKEFLPSFFEAKVLIGLYLFKKLNCSAICLEVGLGGRLDGTNIIDNKICIINKLGFDHTEILGNTIEEIAFEKAGIIKSKNLVVALQTCKNSFAVIEKKALENKANLIKVLPEEVKILHQGIGRVEFEYKTLSNTKLKFTLSQSGGYQAVNATLALKAFEFYLHSKGIKLEDIKDSINQQLESVRMIGRFNILKFNNKTVVLDSAHNAQKLKYFFDSFKTLFPNKRFRLFLSIKDSKDTADILNLLKSVASEFYYFSYQQEGGIKSHSFDQIKQIAQQLGLTPVYIKPDQVEKIITRSDDNLFVITGSMYGLSEVLKNNKNLCQCLEKELY
ncbi:MAG: bifunctional folylpolyglutamate synthase/dihydrofolate synthase [Patescibacteria group bacterium]|nr:MAG: bifunctional folylpolyglutamate synthase/dihydrofolate synthase [Patescibacteria group bacterium]